MLELLTDPHAWISLATLSVLEIVLGIDNIIFLSIVSARLPEHQQARARRIGLGLALLARVILLLGLTWMIGLTRPIFAIGDFEVSWRDIVLAAGGIFLIVKGTVETHHMLEGHGGEGVAGTASFAAVITQIVLLDLVFSLDSVITAIGIAGASSHREAPLSSQDPVTDLTDVYAALDGRNRFAFLHRIQTAVRPETRTRRIEQLTDALAQGKTPYPAPTKKSGS